MILFLSGFLDLNLLGSFFEVIERILDHLQRALKIFEGHHVTNSLLTMLGYINGNLKYCCVRIFYPPVRIKWPATTKMRSAPYLLCIKLVYSD